MPTRTRRFVSAALMFLVGACATPTDPGGGEDPGEGTPTTGALTISISGLPAGLAASVSVTGPGGYSRSLTTGETLTGLAPGTYTVAGAEVAASQGTWAPDVAAATATVSAGATVSATVAYSEQFGSLDVSVSGLPGGTDADITVTGGPGGISEALVASTTLTDLSTGTYSVTAASVVDGGDSYDPTPASQSVTVTANATAAATGIVYALSTSNQLPTAVANGPYVGIVGGAAVTLDATGSSDPDGSIASYSWLLMPGGTTFTGETADVSCFGEQRYEVTLTVEDDQGGTDEASADFVCDPVPDLRVLGRWVTADGSPISAAIVGETVFLDLCSPYERLAEFSGLLTDGASLQYVDRRALESTAPDAHPDCQGTNDRISSLQTSSSVSGLDIQRAWDPDPGVDADGPQGLVRAEYLTVTHGVGQPTLSSVTAKDIFGNAVTLTVDIDPLDVVVPFEASRMVPGPSSTCAIDLSDAAFCWGQNGYSNLGVGSTDNYVMTPAAVVDDLVSAFTDLAHGAGFTCGIDTGGNGWCWGVNQHGQVGNGTQSVTPTPVQVSGSEQYADVAVSGLRTCAATLGGEIRCWGYLNGVSITTPTLVPGSFSATRVVGGGGAFCALASGDAWCWGGSYGDTPVAAATGYGFVELAAGLAHTCGLAADGVAWCWGANTDGQLGDGSTTAAATPVAVAGGLTFSSITAAHYTSCGVTVSGDGYCWGTDITDQIGDDASGGSRLEPTPVAGGHQWKEISSGQAHTCGVTVDDDAYCWGAGLLGRLGAGSFDSSARPQPVRPPG